MCINIYDAKHTMKRKWSGSGQKKKCRSSSSGLKFEHNK